MMLTRDWKKPPQGFLCEVEEESGKPPVGSFLNVMPGGLGGSAAVVVVVEVAVEEEEEEEAEVSPQC